MITELPIRWLRRQGGAAAAPAVPFAPADFSPALKTRLLILQPTPFCNISCDYCYLPDRDITARMPISVVRRAVLRLFEDGLVDEELTVVWHAGEPLAMPRGFYDQAVAAVAEVVAGRCRIIHSIQTNGTLIDAAWCQLFRRHGIRVGVSVDGPALLHDAHRRTRGGQGTHQKVLRGMQLLREHGIEFHTIAVVGPATFRHADAFYDFFVEQGVVDLGCNYDEVEGGNRQSSLLGEESAYGRFLARLLRRSLDSGGAGLRVRELKMAFQQIARATPGYRWKGNVWPDNDQVMPFRLVSVAHNGDFSTFSPELLGQPAPRFNNFTLGNVMASGYLEAACGQVFGSLWSAVLHGIRQCERDCAYFSYCGGGAPANKFYENGDMGSAETLYCRTMVQRPFDTVLAQLEADYQLPGANK